MSAPAPAHAIDLFPIDDIAGNVAGSALHFAGDQVAGAAVAALLGVIKFFVGDLDRELGRQLVHFLLGVNDFTNPSYRALNAYAGYVQAIAWGLLGLVFTAATLRYWLAGFAGAGAHDALQALGRCGGAAAALVALAPAWHLVTIAINRLTYALISGPGVGDQADKVFVGALSVQVVPGAAAPFAGIVLVGSLIAAVALLITKTLMSSGAGGAVPRRAIGDRRSTDRRARVAVARGASEHRGDPLVAGAHRAVLCDLRAAEHRRRGHRRWERRDRAAHPIARRTGGADRCLAAAAGRPAPGPGLQLGARDARPGAPRARRRPGRPTATCSGAMSQPTNPTYQELRRATRLGALTAAQYMQLATSGVLAVAAAMGLVQLGLAVGPALSAGVLVAGAPVVLALVTDGLEFSAISVVVLLARRTRTPRHYAPGAGSAAARLSRRRRAVADAARASRAPARRSERSAHRGRRMTSSR